MEIGKKFGMTVEIIHVDKLWIEGGYTLYSLVISDLLAYLRRLCYHKAEWRKSKMGKKRKILCAGAGLLALWCGWRAFALLSGSAYYGMADVVYAALPAMRYLDATYAALCIGLGVCLAVDAVLLGGRSGRGCKLFRVAIALLAVGEILYGGARCALTGLSPLDIAAVGRLAAYILLYIVNSSYYKDVCSAIQGQTSIKNSVSGGEDHEAGKDPLCGGSVLSGGGSSAGNGETAA